MEQGINLPDSRSNGQGKEIGLLDYLGVLIRWRKFIFINTAVVIAVTSLVVFILPKWYRATASILPPKDPGLLNLMNSSNSVLRGLGGLSRLGGLGQSSTSYNYFAILKSRSMMESVVKKFNLIEVYDVADTSMEKAIKELSGNTAFESQDDDNITIEALDKDPQRAADIANYFVQQLNVRSIELGTQEARGNREFIEKRIQGTKEDLARAENALKDFQEKSGMLITPEQNSNLSALAELYAMKVKQEVELAVLEQRVSKDNEAIRQARLELSELEKKLATIPQAGLSTFRLYRDVIAYQKILEFLAPLYEQAKINEQKDVPVLLVLDNAVPPEKKAKPQRFLIILVASSLSLFFFIMSAFILHGFTRREATNNSPENTFPVLARRAARRYGVPLT